MAIKNNTALLAPTNVKMLERYVRSGKIAADSAATVKDRVGTLAVLIERGGRVTQLFNEKGDVVEVGQQTLGRHGLENLVGFRVVKRHTVLSLVTKEIEVKEEEMKPVESATAPTARVVDEIIVVPMSSPTEQTATVGVLDEGVVIENDDVVVPVVSEVVKTPEEIRSAELHALGDSILNVLDAVCDAAEARKNEATQIAPEPVLVEQTLEQLVGSVLESIAAAEPVAQAVPEKEQPKAEEPKIEELKPQTPPPPKPKAVLAKPKGFFAKLFTGPDPEIVSSQGVNDALDALAKSIRKAA